jgi:hypothetical protein
MQLNMAEMVSGLAAGFRSMVRELLKEYSENSLIL